MKNRFIQTAKKNRAIVAARLDSFNVKNSFNEKSQIFTPSAHRCIEGDIHYSKMANEKFIPALGYDFLTAYYDLTIKLTMPEKEFRRLLVEEVNPKTGEKILEFGFGTGQNLLLMKKQNGDSQLIGLDIDPKVRDIAAYKLAKNNLNIPLDLYDGGAFPYADNHFDKVYSCLVFHQLDAETKLSCLNEIRRVLKPNGTLIIADWGKAQNKLMRLAFGLVQLLDGFKTTNDNVKGLMPQFIEQAGFQNVVVKRSINTMIGTFSYLKANNPLFPYIIIGDNNSRS